MKTFFANGFRPANGFSGKRLGAPFGLDLDLTLPPIGPLPPAPPGDLAPAPAPAAEPAPAPAPAPTPFQPVDFFPQPIYPNYPYTYPVGAVTTPVPEPVEPKIPTYVWAGGAALAAALVIALVIAGKKS